jgi:hypothetical protein
MILAARSPSLLLISFLRSLPFVRDGNSPPAPRPCDSPTQRYVAVRHPEPKYAKRQQAGELFVPHAVWLWAGLAKLPQAGAILRRSHRPYDTK